MNKKRKKTFRTRHGGGKSGHSVKRSRFIAEIRSARRCDIALRIKNSDELTAYFDRDVRSDGDGAVMPKAILCEDEKYYIRPYHTLGAMNGDTVLLKVVSGRDADVIKILHRSTTVVSGTFVEGEDELGRRLPMLEPYDRRVNVPIIIDIPSGDAFPAEGNRLLVRITEYPNEDMPHALGKVVKDYGDASSKNANYAAILEENSVITQFSTEALAQAETLASEPLSLDGRADLRDEYIFTLDGAGAKDLDDAISVKKTDGGWELGVHIADVSHYVRDGSTLDREAQARGTSIYFADRVVPMLPEALSNGACSLNAGVCRYAVSVTVKLDEHGEILETTAQKSVIRSRLRGVYSEFNALISGVADESIMAKYAVIPEDIFKNAIELYEVLSEKSRRRGSLELDTAEAETVLDGDGMPIDITRRERGVGERMIEQFMLCANEGVANWLQKHSFPCIYRVHAQPDTEKLTAFMNFAYSLGLSVPYLKKIPRLTAGHFSELLAQAEVRGVGAPVSAMLLRTMAKARYSDVCSPHFGLGTECYCHFTSPIRRYPDLFVHRMLSAAISGRSSSEISEEYARTAASSAKISSERELCALTVEREMDALFKALYLSAHIGEVHSAYISGVVPFGLFCTLENTCEGLIPLDALEGRYSFNEFSLTLVGAYRSFKLGDSVRVKIVSVDIATRRAEFTLAQEPSDTKTERYRLSRKGRACSP